MRLIDADALVQLLCVNMDTGPQFNRATHCVDVMPTVDAVPVIRCKDCKYWEQLQSRGRCWECVGSRRYTNDDEFCSRADRRMTDERKD